MRSPNQEKAMLRIFVQNMTCGGCEKKIREGLSGIAGVEGVTVDRSQKRVHVVGPATEEEVIEIIKALGFSAEVHPARGSD